MTNEINDELFKRMVLGNQYDILAIIDPENRRAHELAAKLVRENYPIDEVPAAEIIKEYLRYPFTEEDREFVYDVLSLFEYLQRIEDGGYKAPDPWSDANFPGFDGNGETRYMSFARYQIKDLEKWSYLRLSAKDLNSHCPMIDSYRRMLRVWEGMGKPYDLSTEQADAIWAARAHPSYRS